MKKVKKLSRGGRFVDDGDSQKYVEDALDVIDTTPSPVAVGIEPRQLGPMGGGVGGLNELNASSPPATIMPFVAGNNGPEPIRRPMGLMVPRGRGLGASMAGMGGMKKGGTVKKMAKGGSVSSASKRADGCCVKGKTKGRFV